MDATSYKPANLHLRLNWRRQSIIPLRLRDDLTTFLLIIAAIGVAGLIWVRG